MIAELFEIELIVFSILIDSDPESTETHIKKIWLSVKHIVSTNLAIDVFWRPTETFLNDLVELRSYVTLLFTEEVKAYITMLFNH